MPNISPEKFQRVVQQGKKRLKSFKAARAMFLRQYVGQYYDQPSGEVGNEALNLIFNAIRVLVPNLVMNFPTHKVEARYLAHRDYAELLGLALQAHDRQTKIVDVYRRLIVDAVFTLGIMKTGLAASGDILTIDEYGDMDPGEVYTEAVDFDNLVVDPASQEHLFRDAAFIGDILRIPREALLESGLYNAELVERLPKVESHNRGSKAERLSKKTNPGSEDEFFQEMVEVAELWVPAANLRVTVPASDEVILPDFLRVDEYYGPDSGPYTFLAFSPPVPRNPLPVPPVSVWHDLHVLANRITKKIVDQAERQKSVMAYKRAAVDDAKELLDAADGEAVAVDDPEGVVTLQFGGQVQSNEIFLSSLQAWFNSMAANPNQLGGQRFDAQSATEANILHQNASIGLEDMKDHMYRAIAEEAAKRAWFFHTDPLIQLPLIKRVKVPSHYQQVPGGGLMLDTPAHEEEIQVFLTPEARAGDWLDYNFSVEPESMGRKDSNTRYREGMEFATQIVPAAVQSAMALFQMGVPFNVSEFLVRLAKDRGINWLDSVFYDPEFQHRRMMMMSMGPQAEGSQGAVMPNAGLGATLQNGQPGQVQGDQMTPQQQMHSEQQRAAAGPQADLPIRE